MVGRMSKGKDNTFQDNMHRETKRLLLRFNKYSVVLLKENKCTIQISRNKIPDAFSHFYFEMPR
jgi:hypothetical protein